MQNCQSQGNLKSQSQAKPPEQKLREGVETRRAAPKPRIFRETVKG